MSNGDIALDFVGHVKSKKATIEAIDVATRTPEQVETLAELVNDIEDLDDEMLQPFKRTLTGADKLIVDGAYNTYTKRTADQDKSRGQMFNNIFGKTSQLLQAAMKQDSNYLTVIAGNDPLELINLIERTIVAQSKDEYPFKTVFDLERRF
jgi:transcriptional/translational regulatory protein YebC/TACO1